MGENPGSVGVNHAFVHKVFTGVDSHMRANSLDREELSSVS